MFDSNRSIPPYTRVKYLYYGLCVLHSYAIITVSVTLKQTKILMWKMYFNFKKLIEYCLNGNLYFV